MHKESAAILQQVQQVVNGKEEVIEAIWCTLLAGGHVLLEDLPGVGKTTLAQAFGKVLSLENKRLQLTPDTVASDITGFLIYNQQSGQFVLKKGIVMTHLLLADELNRTSTRTQAALLEAMQEKQVTVDEVTYPLPRPFHVIATQNPTGTTGTQPLPLAQLDRFMTKISLGYPSHEAQMALLKNRQGVNPLEYVEELATKEQFLHWQQQVNEIHMADSIFHYVTDLTIATRQHSRLQYGVSPRGALALCQFARARAFYHNRTFVIPEDVYESFMLVCGHRVVGQQTVEALQEILHQVPTPDKLVRR